MLTSFWNFVAKLFGKLFSFMDKVSMAPNRIFLVIGFIGVIGWIVYLIKTRDEEKGKV